MRKSSLYCLLILLSLIFCSNVHAVLQIEITSGSDTSARPLAVVPFGWQSSPGVRNPTDIAAVISADLQRSGLFAPVKRRDMVAKPTDTAQIKFQNWRAIGAEYLVIGNIKSAGANRYSVRFYLFNVLKGSQMVSYSLTSSHKKLRTRAHQISDIIFETITGKPGAFNTKIAYVTFVRSHKQPYRLAVSDSDGANEQVILRSKNAILSPNWSADAKQLAYASFERGKPEIILQNVFTAKRTHLSRLYPALRRATSVSAPSWSPKGDKLAFTMIRNGNCDIFVMNLRTKKVKRLTNHYEIDTEPAWLPDGKHLIFTSSRGGSPQLYKISSNGGRPERLTFEGGYNARASISPDGKLAAFVHGRGNEFFIGILDIERKSIQVLSKEKKTLHESPSFAPNGQMIVYAAGRRGRLAVVSVDGGFNYDYSLKEGIVREPVWSPFNSN